MTWMVVRTKNINPFKTSTDKQFNDGAVIDHQAKIVSLSLPG